MEDHVYRFIQGAEVELRVRSSQLKGMKGIRSNEIVQSTLTSTR